MDKEKFELPKPIASSVEIPPKLLGEIREIANRHHTTDQDVVDKIFRLSLAIIESQDNRSGVFLLKEPNEEMVKIKVFDE